MNTTTQAATDDVRALFEEKVRRGIFRPVARHLREDLVEDRLAEPLQAILLVLAGTTLVSGFLTKFEWVPFLSDVEVTHPLLHVIVLSEAAFWLLTLLGCGGVFGYVNRRCAA
jgi:hypothetical protein